MSPEYNHSFPGLLKHVLDGYLKEYIHKAVGIVGVSAGSFGGTRGIQDLLPVLRELGLVTIFWDVNIGPVGRVFDERGRSSTRRSSAAPTSSSTSSSGWRRRSATAARTSRSSDAGGPRCAAPDAGPR